MPRVKSIELPAWATGFVYLLETSERWQKIGYSEDPQSRAGDFQSLPFCVWLTHFFPVCHHSIEKTIMRSLSHKRLRQEWFVLGREDIERFRGVTEVRSVKDLPAELRTVVVIAPPVPVFKNRHRGRGAAGAWWRSAARCWYTTHKNRQYPLGVYEPDKQGEAEEAARRLLAHLKAEPKQ
jgi:hypothetical protein